MNLIQSGAVDSVSKNPPVPAEYGGAGADLDVVYAKTKPEWAHDCTNAFVVEKDAPGFSAVRPLIKIGVRISQNSGRVFRACENPAQSLVIWAIMLYPPNRSCIDRAFHV